LAEDAQRLIRSGEDEWKWVRGSASQPE